MSNTKSLVVALALAGVVVGSGYYVWHARQDPAGLATGRSTPRAGQIWTRLQAYKDSYLRRYFMAFEREQPVATDALEAFNELAYQVTGPGGFWRKEVPNRWLGCKAQPESASCGAIGEMTEDMARWDTLQEQIAAVDGAGAGRFLDEHAADMLTYLDTMVPEEPSSAGMQKTPLFEKKLKAAMESDGML